MTLSYHEEIMAAYYNENDPKAAAWLRSLMEADLIPSGTVDERSIADVRPQDLYGFEQVHFFAGIGGWAYALRLAEWPEGVPVWTGSCPCQPFSQAGKGKGEKDERHLWPEFERLIAECGPAIVFGEQVASKAGRGWLSRVRLDLEALGYGVGAADLCAAGVGAPHIRQRLFWVAYSESARLSRGKARDKTCENRQQPVGSSDSCRLADTNGGNTCEKREQSSGEHGQQPQDGCNGRLEHTESIGREQGQSESARCSERDESEGAIETGQPSCGSLSGFWSDFDLIPCRDGKARRIESGLEPLAHGIPGRVAQLRGLGNAIVPQVAEEFIGAFLDEFG